MCSEKPKASCDSLCCDIRLSAVVWTQNRRLWEVPVSGTGKETHGLSVCSWSPRPGVLRWRLRRPRESLCASQLREAAQSLAPLRLPAQMLFSLPAFQSLKLPFVSGRGPPQGPHLNESTSVKATSKSGPILRCWGSGLQHKFWRGYNSTHKSTTE